jgi:hypothetical protein
MSMLRHVPIIKKQSLCRVDIVGQEDTWYRKSFTLEMAPISMMPHSIHLFLQQVSYGLWNKRWFYIHGPHVLLAGRDNKKKKTKILSIILLLVFWLLFVVH